MRTSQSTQGNVLCVKLSLNVADGFLVLSIHVCLLLTKKGHRPSKDTGRSHDIGPTCAPIKLTRRT